MKQNTKVNLHNRFDIEVKDSRTGEIRQKAFAENIILDQAWTQILAARSWFTRIYYGTGTGIISASRTALFTQLGYKTAGTPVYNSSVVDNWFSLRQSIAILENEHVGAALSEVGIGTDVLCTHAVLKDMNGNPVTIVKTDTDIITIYATVYLQPSTISADSTGVAFVRSDVPNAIVRKLLGTNVWAQHGDVAFLAVIGLMRGATARSIEPNSVPEEYFDYVTGGINWVPDVANRRIRLYHRVAASLANTTKGYAGYMVAGVGDNPPMFFPELIGRFNSSTLTQPTITEQIGVGNGTTKDFATTFPFVKSGAVIEVDGVVLSPTVLSGLPNTKDLFPHMFNRTNAEMPDMNCFVATGIPATQQIIENPYYATYGITSMVGRRISIESSDDMMTWTQCINIDGEIETAVPAGHQNKRYFRVSRLGAYTEYCYLKNAFCASLDNFKNVRFATAPANGAVITAEYTCDCAAKDVNHVLDIDVSIQLGEYTP